MATLPSPSSLKEKRPREVDVVDHRPPTSQHSVVFLQFFFSGHKNQGKSFGSTLLLFFSHQHCISIQRLSCPSWDWMRNFSKRGAEFPLSLAKCDKVCCVLLTMEIPTSTTNSQIWATTIIRQSYPLVRTVYHEKLSCLLCCPDSLFWWQPDSSPRMVCG